MLSRLGSYFPSFSSTESSSSGYGHDRIYDHDHDHDEYDIRDPHGSSTASSSVPPNSFFRRLAAIPGSRSVSPTLHPYRGTLSRKSKKSRGSWRSALFAGWGPNRLTALRLTVLLGMAVWYVFRYRWEIQVEFSMYNKPWIESEILSLENPPTADLAETCFSPSALDAQANLRPTVQPSTWNYSSIYSHTPSVIQLQSTLALTHPDDCFDYASLIQPSLLAKRKHLTYHTYWRGDLLPFGERQEWTIKSFLATQPLDRSTFILWSNVDLVELNPRVAQLAKLYGKNLKVKKIDIKQMAKGTMLEGRMDLLGGAIKDQRAWVDGDLVRLLVLWTHGGVWADMDMIFLRDLHVLTEDEWVTQWDCYNKPYRSLNGALLHFHRQSPFLCSLFHIMARSPPPRPKSTDWGSHLYLKAHRRLLSQGIVPFQVLPWCFADPRNCREDKRVPDPFKKDPGWYAGLMWNKGGKEKLKKHLDWSKDKGVFVLHLHNQWQKDFPPNGWVRQLLLEPMDKRLKDRISESR
ncbi:Glycosyltransferase, DXD sugar-binding motif [Phaffia rhodozyma]|uniref:Glycosyltransferase, DXD sugar-binding motif n=1 Tax=Phaffia rhodozyma TaxID=264483 RepID=A0A0F7SR91_PHARH|nr:Glycosyltransferase, DXD sugar-binding motif [Phaffia rhodozyma]